MSQFALGRRQGWVDAVAVAEQMAEAADELAQAAPDELRRNLYRGGALAMRSFANAVPTTPERVAAAMLAIEDGCE